MAAPKTPSLTNKPADPGAELLKKLDLSEEAIRPSAEPEPESGASDPAPADEAPRRIPAKLVGQAKRLGLTEDELAELDTPEAYERAIAEVRAEQRVERPRDPDTGRFLSQPAQNPDLVEHPFELDQIGVDAGKWGEETTTKQIMTESLGPLLKRIKHLEARLEQAEGRERSRVQEEGLNRLDKRFSEDGDFFGSGSWRKTKDAAHLRRRKAMIGAIGDAFSADPNQDFDDVFDQAKADLFGQKDQAPAKPAAKPVRPVRRPEPVEVDDDDDDPLHFRNGHSRLPQGRNGAPPAKGEKFATQELARQMRRMGGEVAYEVSSDDERSTLPD